MTVFEKLKEKLTVDDIIILLHDDTIDWLDGRNMCQACEADNGGHCPAGDWCAFVDNPGLYEVLMRQDSGINFKEFFERFGGVNNDH